MKCKRTRTNELDNQVTSSAVDVIGQDVLSLAQAARFLPEVEGRRIHPSTVWRWCRKGLRGVTLDYVRVGRRIVVSRRSLSEFCRRLAQADELPVGGPSKPAVRAPRRSPPQRKRDIEAARRQLDAAGI